MSKKTKPYGLGQRAAEVQRLNVIEDAMPEQWKVGQPSGDFVKRRAQKLRAELVKAG